MRPFLTTTDDHEVGLDPSVFAAVHDAASKDRFAYYARPTSASFVWGP
jgi:hypothetical protein